MDHYSYRHCPNCLAEYREGFETCADCGTSLVDGPAPVSEEHAPERTRGHPHPGEDRDDAPVVLCSLPQDEAEILAGRLRGEGLTAAVDDVSIGSMFHLSLPQFRLVRVWVLESQLKKARAAARRALSGEDAI